MTLHGLQPDAALWLVGVAALAFLLGAVAQAVCGFGGALVSVPVLSLATDPATAVVASTLLGIVIASFGYRRDREHVARETSDRLILFSFLGMPVGIVVFAFADHRVLAIAISCTLLVLTFLTMLGRKPGSRRGGDAVTGLVSGALVTSTGFNGPPLALHLVDLPPRTCRATLQRIFIGQDAVAALLFALVGQLTVLAVGAAAVGLAMVPLGWRLGDRAFARLDERTSRVLVLCMLLASGIVLLVRSL